MVERRATAAQEEPAVEAMEEERIAIEEEKRKRSRRRRSEATGGDVGERKSEREKWWRGKFFSRPPHFFLLSRSPSTSTSIAPFFLSEASACPRFPPSAPLRVSPLPARRPPPAHRAPPLPLPRLRCGEKKEERREGEFFLLCSVCFQSRWRKHALPFHFPRSTRLPLRKPRAPAHHQVTLHTRVCARKLTRLLASTHKNKRPSKFSSATLQTLALSSSLSSPSSSSSRTTRLCPAKAAAAEASTSLYDRLGGDAIKLVTSMLFDK